MNGSTAQLAALTCHANAFLSGREVPEFFPGNSTCQFNESITFAVRDDVVAATPNAWFQHLRDTGVDGVRFVHEPSENPQFPDHMTSGFVGGGGNTVIAARRAGVLDLWMPGWKYLDPNAKDRRVWSVRYELFSAVEELLPEKTPEQATMALKAPLKRILDFTKRHRRGAFSDHFTRALAHLEGESTTPAFHQDLFVAGTLSETSTRLLNACQAAWVFGGMGSWNDAHPGDEAGTGEYKELSPALYAALLDGVTAAVNETDRR